MFVNVRVHSTKKRAISILAFALVLSSVLIGVKKLASVGRMQPDTAEAHLIGVASKGLLMPVIALRLRDASLESQWSSALAQAIDGQHEVTVANGRIDVLTDFYAIEVDRLEKWHEGIGQAAHYSAETGKLACLALMIDTDIWPPSSATLEKLFLIEKIALSQGIRLVLLRRDLT